LIFFARFRAATQVYIIHKMALHKVALRNYCYAIQTENSIFVY